MKRQYENINFKPESLELIQQCDQIIQDYQQQGLVLSLRQLYYVLVSANKIPNTERSYKRLGKQVANGRLAGLLDWAGIEDRGREPVEQAEWSSIQSLVRGALRGYRLPRLEGQDVYCELWVEKAALAGVLEPLGEEFHVVVMVNKGYSSLSAMYEAAKRIEWNVEQYGCQEAMVLYLGDLDPSGEDMVRDVDERLERFDCDCEVRKLALTIEQVREYNLPPNPAKLSDSRAAAFIQQYGPESWEVDALPPRTLQALVRAELEELLDLELMREIQAREERDKEQLEEAAEALR